MEYLIIIKFGLGILTEEGPLVDSKCWFLMDILDINKEIFFSPKPGLWVGDGAKPNSIKYIEVTVYILDLYLMDIKL